MSLSLSVDSRPAVHAPPFPGVRRFIRVVLAAAALCMAIWLMLSAVLWAGQSRWVFMTELSRDEPAVYDSSLFMPVTFDTADHLRLHGVVLTHDGGAPWILFCPPAGSRFYLPEHLKQLWEFGYNVFAFEYRGFADSPGTPSEDGLYADARAAYAYLTNQRGVDGRQIILSGRSLGSAVATELATEVPARGLALFGAIDSVPRVASRFYPWAPGWLARYQFDTRRRAPLVAVPVLIVQGRGDMYTPYVPTRELAAAFHGRTRLLMTDGGHHFSGFWWPLELQRALVEFWPVD